MTSCRKFCHQTAQKNIIKLKTWSKKVWYIYLSIFNQLFANIFKGLKSSWRMAIMIFFGADFAIQITLKCFEQQSTLLGAYFSLQLLLKGQSHEFFDLRFFHHSIPSGPQVNRPKWFRFQFVFAEIFNY